VGQVSRRRIIGIPGGGGREGKAEERERRVKGKSLLTIVVITTIIPDGNPGGSQ